MKLRGSLANVRLLGIIYLQRLASVLKTRSDATTDNVCTGTCSVFKRRVETFHRTAVQTEA